MKEHNFSENQARKYLTRSSMNRQPLPEDFLYKEIISVLERKGDEKYKDFWLLISYSTLFYTQFLSDREIRDFVLTKIQSEEDGLVYLIRRIFKKIIFVPMNKFTSVPFNKGLGDHQIFEWDV